MAPSASLHVVVRGTVQGVGFRWFTRRVARRLGLAGWVANRPDGTVEVVAAGPAQALAVLERELSRGPVGARVEAIELVAPEPAVTLPDPFEIR